MDWKFDLSNLQPPPPGLGLLVRLREVSGDAFPDKGRLIHAIADTAVLIEALENNGKLNLDDGTLVRVQAFYTDMLEMLNRIPGPDIVSCFGRHESILGVASRGGGRR